MTDMEEKIKELWLYDIDQERQEKVSLIVLQMQTLLWHRCESVD